jgi:7-cyano-7-deazaguanine synthase
MKVSETMDTNNINVSVLLSGGLDSSACIHYYLSQSFKVNAIFIDYGQKANENELNSAINIARHYDTNLDYLKFSSQQKFSEGEIRGRNAFLVMAVLLAYPTIKGVISMGIHSGTSYYDCSELFVKNINDILNNYTSGQLILDVPFLKWDKRMIFNYCRDKGIPINLTYSCENGTDVPCGRCLSCLDRGALDVS